MKTITYNPETHALVPREPSEEMIQRGCLSQSETAHPTYESWWDSHSSGISERIRLYLKKVYQDMLAAAQQPEPVDVGSVGWKHDCAALCANDIELWIDRCPHCGKPRHNPAERQNLKPR